MEYVLSHSSAFLFWRHYSSARKALAKTRRRGGMTERPSVAGLPTDTLAFCGVPVSPKSPVHLLLADQTLRSHADIFRCHVSSTEFPPSSFLRIADGLVVSSPELTFAQLAETRPFLKLLLLGSELCGCYAHVPGSSGLPTRSPLTTPKAIRQYLDLLPERPGIMRARRAADFLVSNAASPMEIKLALLLSLPQRYGGYGLPTPQLNPEIELGPEARKAYPHGTCRPDLFWSESRLDLEYHGTDSHTGQEALASDLARQTALMAEGIEVYPVSYAQVADADVLDSVARTIAAKLGVRLRIRNPHFLDNRATLREALALDQPSFGGQR